MIKVDWILVGKHYLKSQRDGNHHLKEIEIITIETCDGITTNHIVHSQGWSKVPAKEITRGGEVSVAEISALSIQCCVWPTWLVRAKSANRST